MIGKEITVKFENTQAFLILGVPVNFQQDAIAVRLNTFDSLAFWDLRILNYFPDQRRLFAEVIAYSSSENKFKANVLNASEELKDVEFIAFKSIDTYQLLGTFDRPPIQRKPKSYEPKKRELPETFTISIKKIRFKNGGISFEKKLSNLKYSQEFEIPNPDIREEYDAIKDYFSNVLGTKKIQVTVKITTLDDEITSIELNSPEIKRITGDLIENVRLAFVRKTMKSRGSDADRNLYSMGDYFEEFGNKFNPDIFYGNEHEFIEDLIKTTSSKHYNQLRFLSGKHIYKELKVQFVPKPISFVFLIPGKTMNYLVWETLDTEEATYVWRITKDVAELNASLINLESEIHEIKSAGKLEFLRKDDDNFGRVYHDYSDEVAGFVKWKAELQKLLT